jgi:outer membrane putative beta-barrel porin/alpha-amylase
MTLYLRVGGRKAVRLVMLLLGACGTVTAIRAQDLNPRAYLITPIHSHAVTLSYTFNDGPVFTDPTVPIEDLTGRFHLQTAGFYHAFSLFGRSSNTAVVVPYAVGNFQGKVVGVQNEIYRSGLADARLRFSINLIGGRAMAPDEFMKWRQKFLLGVSLSVSAPTGQYDPARLINPGVNRWGFKPELGLSRRWGKWTLDAYGGIWLFAANDQFFPGLSRRTQDPIYILESHLSYSLKPRLWFSLDGNFWTGGRSNVNGVYNYDLQKNSRIGGTASLPMTKHQSLKLSFNTGAYVSVGGNYKTISVGWQYSWVGKKW